MFLFGVGVALGAGLLTGLLSLLLHGMYASMKQRKRFEGVFLPAFSIASLAVAMAAAMIEAESTYEFESPWHVAGLSIAATACLATIYAGIRRGANAKSLLITFVTSAVTAACGIAVTVLVGALLLSQVSFMM